MGRLNAASHSFAAEHIERSDRSYAEDLAAHYNRHLFRDDIEWAVGSNDQLYLRDKQSFTASHTRELERKTESERTQWLRNHKT